jgi:predicted lysophospholipase L1 biosynthesis ABC-type transport system permease subunit
VPTIIINAILARQMFGDEDPVGRHMKPFAGDVPLSHHWDGEASPREIVGVVGNVRQSGMVEGLEPIVYVPYQQVGWPLLGELVVRSVGSPLEIVSQLKSEVWELDRNLPVSDIRTMEEILAGSVGREQRVTVLLSFFAGVALLLAAVGIYGIVSYGARQRTQEIGVRMALGAQRVDVLRLVLAQGLVLTSIGIVVGLAAAVAVTRVLTNLLYEISSTDAVTYGAVSLLLVLVSVVAGLVPALRAVRLHPVTALRYE